MSLSSATVTSVMCSSVSVAVSPSPILRSGSCKMWAGNGRKGVTAFLYSPNIVCFTSITKPQDGPRCGGDVGFLLTAFSKGEWKKVTAIWEWMGEPLQTVYKSRVKLDLTECWWRKRMYIQHCLKEQEVLSEHLNQTEVVLLLFFLFKLVLSYDISFSVIFFFFFLMLRLFFTFTYASASVQPAEIQLHLLPVCYQRVRCWNEDLAGYCVDDKWKRSKHSLLVCSYSGSAGLAVVKTCYLLIKHATPSSEKKLRWTLSQCDRLPVMPAWNLSLLCWLNL